jgi:hypothetical protein
MFVEIRFTDGRGTRWSRGPSGVLVELPPGTPLLTTPPPDDAEELEEPDLNRNRPGAVKGVAGP